MNKQRNFIGVVAGQSGVPIKTIRYYEEIGLLPKPPRTNAHYRLYSLQTVERLQFIKKSQNLGLQLKDVKEILDLTDRGKCPCGHVQKLLKSRLQELREKIRDMRILERQLKNATQSGCPPNFKPRGKALCPTIQRQQIKKGRRP